MCVCIFGISFTYVIKSIDSKLISLKYTKVKLLTLNNFAPEEQFLIKRNTNRTKSPNRYSSKILPIH